MDPIKQEEYDRRYDRMSVFATRDRVLDVAKDCLSQSQLDELLLYALASWVEGFDMSFDKATVRNATEEFEKEMDERLDRHIEDEYVSRHT